MQENFRHDSAGPATSASRMSSATKKRIAFALLMGALTTGVISFVLVGIHQGVSTHTFPVWLRSWGIAYMVVVPAILLIGPRLQTLIDRWIA